MGAAARVGDMTSHGAPLGPGLGSPNVIIGGQPAWRAVIDTHICPLSEGLQPHVGGVVIQGSAKVFINGFPAARQGDMLIEVGPTDSISAGCFKVQIGG